VGLKTKYGILAVRPVLQKPLERMEFPREEQDGARLREIFGGRRRESVAWDITGRKEEEGREKGGRVRGRDVVWDGSK